ncbi:hypothetical protein PHISCL_00220 [Aspergillus sclerotialis]|uniref:Uncharacterized protein n=1 Tax=Aspergillus sclerotialis TaxID=2070753 RepID=A0A3A2ZWR7_9EURO|nr:hypothetical protein PHISCL_00220 [Aspergillus sclerotialis]
MGAVQFVHFQETPVIAAEHLQGCSVVIIASTYGAILGHITPLPPDPSTDELGYENVRSMMRRVATLYHYYRAQHFFPTAGTVIVCAGRDGTIRLPDQVHIMQSCFNEIGYNPMTRIYEAPWIANFPGRGMVIVRSWLNNQPPTVYVEDQPI